MSRYRNLGVLGVRWSGLMSVVAAVIALAIGVVGPWTMGAMGRGYVGRMPVGADEAMPYGWGHMMGGGWGMSWGPTVLLALVGAVLIAASRPLGTWLGAGLEDGD